MLNLKKGLAVVLAAATALTFAPVANLGQAISAYADDPSTQTTKEGATLITSGGSYDKSITKNDVYTYYVQLDQAKFGAKYYVTISDSTVVTLGLQETGKAFAAYSGTYPTANSASEADIANGEAFAIKALKPGKVTVTVKASKGATTNIKTFELTVADLSDAPQFKLTKAGDAPYTDDTAFSEDTRRNVTVFSPTNIQTAADYVTLTIGPSALTHVYHVTSATVPSSSSSLMTAEKTSDTEVKLRFTNVGTATLNLSLEDQATAHSSNKPNVSLTFVIAAADSTFKIDDSEISVATSKSDAPVKTIPLTEAVSTGKIGASLTNGKSDEKISYFIYKTDKDGVPQEWTTKPSSAIAANTLANLNTTAGAGTGTAAQSGDLTIDADGTVHATANALNATEQYYSIAVANKASATANKVAWIRVVSIRNSKLFTNVKLSVDGNNYTASAKYDKSGNTEDGSESKSLEMSTADFTSADFTATGNDTALAASEITSSDPSTVAVEGNKLVAKKIGTSIVTFTKKSDTTHYGNATITLNVTVSNRYVKNEITADDIVLNKANLTAKINAKSTPATTYHYEVGHGTTDKWTAQSDAHITVAADGTVTFDGNGYGATQILITGDAKNDAKAPKAKVINVTYSNLTQADLNVTTKTLKLNVGETGSIVASGTALSYVSSDEDVATVDAQGNVTAVAAGTAVITVKSAGSATVSPAQDTVIVTVKSAAQKPAKVTGLKVSNKKGAYVSVKWTSQGKNINYRVYKKVGNGKWVGKNVAGSKTTLSVKKGAKVQVKVKAYVKDANGKTTWGPKATKAKTFKTDKK